MNEIYRRQNIMSEENVEFDKRFLTIFCLHTKESQNAVLFLNLVLSRSLSCTIFEFSHILVSSLLTSPFEYNRRTAFEK